VNERTKTGQRKHDESVSRSAEWYKKHGFKIKADLPGWNKPKKIGGFIPVLSLLLVNNGNLFITKEDVLYKFIIKGLKK